MKLIAQVKLQPSTEQRQALLQTLETVNNAANYISKHAWDTKTFRQFDLHHALYYNIRQTFKLTAQLVIRVLSKVTDSYKVDRKTMRVFRKHGGIAYDKRILSWKLAQQMVSIWTVGGRATIRFAAGVKQLQLLEYISGEADLIYRDGEFYLHQVCEMEEPPPGDVKEFLGVDLGIKNIAVDSDGQVFAGGQVNGLRKRHAKLRAKLQSKGTKAATRLLKKRSKKEQRFANHVNHCISKRIVGKAKDTGRGIALEDLKGIRGRVAVRKAERRQHSSWAFADLRAKIEYKARLSGIPVVAVDPRHTSQTCPACGSIDRLNRPSQSLFSCISCGFVGHSDTIAAGNIASRAACKPARLLAQPVGPGRDKLSAFS